VDGTPEVPPIIPPTLESAEPDVLHEEAPPGEDEPAREEDAVADAASLLEPEPTPEVLP
jgi:hypothetical protein